MSFYELAGTGDLWRVHVPCAHGLGELTGHQKPGVVAAKHCQQLLGHFLEEAGRQSQGHEAAPGEEQAELRHAETTMPSSCTLTQNRAHGELVGQARPSWPEPQNPSPMTHGGWAA